MRAAINDLSMTGFAYLPSMVDEEQLAVLRIAVEKVRTKERRAGLRNLLSRCPEVREFALSPTLLEIVREVVGDSATLLPVRAILFDKTPDANWYVTWHQDLSIPVQERPAPNCDLRGYGPWSEKDGVVHVQPPCAVLESMVSLRIHLDPCPERNGAIRFVAGSHRSGILDQDAICAFRDRKEWSTVPAFPGDIIVMRPLVLHSSSQSESPEQRRVLHIEYAGCELLFPLRFRQA